MKKIKKTLSLNKLVISKLANPTSIMGGSFNCGEASKVRPLCTGISNDEGGPCQKSNQTDCTQLTTNLEC